MDGAVGAELGQAEDRVAHVALGEQEDELVAQPRRREVADEAHLDGAARELRGVLVHAEPVPVLVPDRAKDPRRVVDEREVVQDADHAGVEVGPAAERVDEPPEVVALERDRHRVDREVAPEEVLADRRVLDGRERRRRVVELGPRRHDVDAAAVAVEHDRCAELRVRPHAAVERFCERLRELDGVALDGDVDVEALLAEKDVADRPADEVDALVALADGRDRLERGREVLQALELAEQVRAALFLPLLACPESREHVAPRDDADDLLPLQHRDATLGLDEPLNLGERRPRLATGDARAHDPLHRSVREPVTDRLVEVLTCDRADEATVVEDEDPALPVPLAHHHRVRNRLVGARRS